MQNGCQLNGRAGRCVCVYAELHCLCAIACSDVHSMAKAFFLFKNKLQKVFRFTKRTIIIMMERGDCTTSAISIFITEKYGCSIQTDTGLQYRSVCFSFLFFFGTGIEGCGADQSHGTRTAPELIRKNGKQKRGNDGKHKGLVRPMVKREAGTFNIKMMWCS